MNITEFALVLFVSVIGQNAPQQSFLQSLRKANFQTAIMLSVSAANATIFEDIRYYYAAAGCSPYREPSPFALIQQLGKVSTLVFYTVFHRFNSQFEY